MRVHSYTRQAQTQPKARPTSSMRTRTRTHTEHTLGWRNAAVGVRAHCHRSCNSRPSYLLVCSERACVRDWPRYAGCFVRSALASNVTRPIEHVILFTWCDVSTPTRRMGVSDRDVASLRNKSTHRGAKRFAVSVFCLPTMAPRASAPARHCGDLVFQLAIGWIIVATARARSIITNTDQVRDKKLLHATCSRPAFARICNSTFWRVQRLTLL